MKVYEVTGPAGLKTTVQLSDEDAKERGLKASDQVGEVDDHSPDVNTVGVDEKSTAAANKATTASNKAVGSK